MPALYHKAIEEAACQIVNAKGFYLLIFSIALETFALSTLETLPFYEMNAKGFLSALVCAI